MGALERIENLVRRYCSGRDAQGNPYTLADDVRMSSLKALLPNDLEKHVQLNRARLTSYVVLKSKHTVRAEVMHMLEARCRNGPSHPEGDDPMDIGPFGKGKGQQGQHVQQDKKKDKNKDSIEY